MVRSAIANPLTAMSHQSHLPHAPSITAPPASATAVALPTAPGVIRASDLLGSRQAVEIEHNGQHYRLQTTRAGKLILTK